MLEPAARPIQRAVRPFLARRRVELRRDALRREHEWRVQGGVDAVLARKFCRDRILVDTCFAAAEGRLKERVRGQARIICCVVSFACLWRSSIESGEVGACAVRPSRFADDKHVVFL